MEPLPADSVLVQNQHYLAPSGDLFAFLGDDYLPNGYVNITGGGTPVTPTGRVGAISTAVVDAELFTGDADAIDNTSVFYMDNAGTNAPPFADTDGGIATAISTDGAKKQIWWGSNGVLGIRGAPNSGVYEAWIQMASLTDIPDPQDLQEVTVQGNTTDQLVHITGNNNDPVTPGLSLLATPASGSAEIVNRGGNSPIGWLFLGNMGANGAIRTSPGGGNGAQPVTIFGGTTPTNNISITAPGKITCDPGTNPTDVVVLSQLDDYLLSVAAGTNVTIDDTDPQNPVINASGGITTVDLGYTASPTDGVVTNSAGNNAILPAATATDAGLFLPAEKTKLANLDVTEFVSATPVDPTNQTFYEGDLGSISNTSIIYADNGAINAPAFATTDGTVITNMGNIGAKRQMWWGRNGEIGIRGSNAQGVYDAWVQIAAVDAIPDPQNLQDVTNIGSETTSTLTHAAAVTTGQSLTTENAGFALAWNDADNMLEWGNTQTVGGNMLHYIPLNTNESISLGSPLGADDPLFHLAYGATPADSEWQLRTTSAPATNAALFNGTANDLEMRIVNTADEVKAISISRLGSMQVVDSINQVGLTNNGDYEANFVPRSLATVQYVDSVAGNVIGLPGTVSFPQVPANSSLDGTNTISNANADIDDYVIVQETGGGISPLETIFIGRVSTPGEITVRRYNPTTSAIPAETDLTLRLFIVKFN